MGSKQSSLAKLPPIAKEHWEQIPIPSSIHKKSSHGQYKLLTNVLTNQKIEQYNIVFQSNQEYQHYIESFRWRERAEDIINTKYLQVTTDTSFCGTSMYAKVYIEHTIYRLSSISDIPIPQNLYMLSSVLNGFHKLYKLIGYFKPNEDMIGIDSEGRVKVWLNSNFSKNYLFGPHYVEGIINSYDQQEEESKIVRQTVQLIDQNTFYEHNFPKLATFIQSRNAKLTFQNTRNLIVQYSKRFGLSIPSYFVSLLHLFDESQKSQQSEQVREQSITNNPFKVSQSNIQDHSNIIHYINPDLNIDKKVEENQLKSFTKIEQQLIELQRENDTTNETMFKNSRKTSFNPTRKYKKCQQFKKQLPQIQFRYISRQALPQPIQKKRSYKQQQFVPEIVMPLPKIRENSLLESGNNTKRLTYSDINQDYQLDEQLAEDLLKYFSK